MYPKLHELDYFENDSLQGYKIYNFIKKYNTEIGIIGDLIVKTPVSEWPSIIDTELANHKKVLIFVPDPRILGSDNREIPDLLNSYSDESLYLVTQLDSYSQQNLLHQQGITCKLIELPWMDVNELLSWYYGKQLIEIESVIGPSTNFICPIGRNEWHKTLLAESLTEKFSDIGNVYFTEKPTNFKYNPVMSPVPNYNKTRTSVPEYSTDLNACSKNILYNKSVTMNTENFAKLIYFCKNSPMVIHPETTVGTFLTTEKTLWPILGGKLQLVFGRRYNHRYIQQFIETDYYQHFDMSFDNMEAYTQQKQIEKLECMLENNRYQIKHAFELHTELKDSLEKDKINLIQNMYNFFIQQLNSI